MRKHLKGRYSLLFSVIAIYLAIALLVRLALTIWSFRLLEGSFFNILKSFATGFCYDLSVGLFFVTFYNLYLLFFPGRLAGSIADRILTYFILGVTLFVMFFGSMAEFPFWDEFGARFNFIAVDYLIYTYEVVENINESYPLPLLILILLSLTFISLWSLKKLKISEVVFKDKAPFLKRLAISAVLLALTCSFVFLLNNKDAEFSGNRVAGELGKNGIFSLFAAYKSNELDYETFYRTLPPRQAYGILKKELLQENQQYVSQDYDAISRLTSSDDSTESRPNIIMITIESLSASFSSHFGNTENLTPRFDSLANKGIFFTNMYATGTRTVRGMEALSLSVPPTPGNSIVRRPDNKNLFSVASVLSARNYGLYFIYGGDGYFDNMNAFFGGQGFSIVDRDRGNPLPESVDTQRYKITDKEVIFENAWGICDEDIYSQALKYADMEAGRNRPFFQFIMTTSNHRPYSFPEGKISMEPGSREGAVKYTDFALGEFLEKVKDKPWFDNTVFVIVADHCASSAGKWEIDISRHHIPAIIYNLHRGPEAISRLTSQIDVIPTLFGYLGWQYQSSFYGKDINKTPEGSERAFIGNYRTLGVLKGDIFSQIDDRKGVRQFKWEKNSGDLEEIPAARIDTTLVNEAVSYYQTASERFKNGKMKL